MAVAERRLTIPQQLRSELVIYWPLADSAADLKSALYDSKGPYDLTNNNTATRADGPSDNLPDAVGLVQASSQYLNRVDADLALGGDSFEVTCWVFQSSTTGARTVLSDYLTTGNQRSWWLQFGSGSSTPVIVMSTDGTASDQLAGSSAISTSSWAMLDIFFDSNRGVKGISINNGAFATSAQASVFKSTAGNFHIGARSGPVDLMDGRIGSVSMHRRILAQSERDWLYNNGVGRSLERGC